MRGEETLDWSVLEIPGVEEAALNAAKAVSRSEDYAEYVELEDLQQEAKIVAAGMAGEIAMAERGDGIGLGAIKHRIHMDLIDIVKTDVKRRQKQQSYEQRYQTEDESGEYAPRPVQIVLRQDTVEYDRELVESLMPAIWDESFCYGMKQENAPDADMPRGSINKATGNTLAAHIADIKTGWKKAPLTLKEKRALILGYGLDWKVKEIAYNQGCTKQTISERLANGISKIVATLNGKDDSRWMTEEDA